MGGKKEKKSLAEIKSARLNPIREKDRRVLEIIKYYEDQGRNFKEYICDLILDSEGYDPKQFPTEQDSDATKIITRIEDMFASFAQEMINKIKRAGNSSFTWDEGFNSNDDSEGTTDEPSMFAKTFANKFLQRQENVLESDDE